MSGGACLAQGPGRHPLRGGKEAAIARKKGIEPEAAALQLADQQIEEAVAGVAGHQEAATTAERVAQSGIWACPTPSWRASSSRWRRCRGGRADSCQRMGGGWGADNQPWGGV